MRLSISNHFLPIRTPTSCHLPGLLCRTCRWLPPFRTHNSAVLCVLSHPDSEERFLKGPQPVTRVSGVPSLGPKSWERSGHVASSLKPLRPYCSAHRHSPVRNSGSEPEITHHHLVNITSAPAQGPPNHCGSKYKCLHPTQTPSLPRGLSARE